MESEFENNIKSVYDTLLKKLYLGKYTFYIFVLLLCNDLFKPIAQRTFPDPQVVIHGMEKFGENDQFDNALRSFVYVYVMYLRLATTAFFKINKNRIDVGHSYRVLKAYNFVRSYISQKRRIPTHEAQKHYKTLDELFQKYDFENIVCKKMNDSNFCTSNECFEVKMYNMKISKLSPVITQ